MPSKKQHHTIPITKQKLSSQNQAINRSNKAQLKQIQLIEIKKEKPKVPTVDLYIRYQGKWIFKGKTCRYCGLILEDPTVIDKHQYVCRVLNSKRDDEDYIHPSLNTGRKVNTPKGVYTIREAAKLYDVTEEAIRYRIKTKKKGYSYADSQD